VNRLPLALLIVFGAAWANAAQAGERPGAQRTCAGVYSDDLTVLARRVRDFERDPHNQYSYCLRTAAVYECLSYASDGSMRRARKPAIAHGTGFAWRGSGGETYLLTNDHVATWPTVTDEEHPIEGVPAGCKRVSETVRIVDNEDDGYEANDIPLTLVVSDPLTDVAVLKTRSALRTIPYRIGRSADLRIGNVVVVHGFPLGVFAATNVGKVVNANDHDTDREWDHVDFVIDALVSSGNSGSPVLALSCRTGEYELVGIYHAGYVHGSALNIAVGIDQLRDLMTLFKRSARLDEGGAGRFDMAERKLLQDSLASLAATLFFSFGPFTASVRALPDGALWFEVYSRHFPRSDERLMMFEDLPGETAGRIYLGNRRGLRSVDRAALDADGRSQLERVLGRLRGAAAATVRLRATNVLSKQGETRRKALTRLRERQSATERDAAQLLGDLSERLGPRLEDKAMTALEAIAPPELGTPARATTPGE
jgi:S1-C subfamily serine protease